MWLLALAGQLAAALGFAYLYRQEILGLTVSPRLRPPADPALSSPTA